MNGYQYTPRAGRTPRTARTDPGAIRPLAGASRALVFALLLCLCIAPAARSAPMKVLDINVIGNRRVSTQQIMGVIPHTARPGRIIDDVDALLELVESKVRGMGYFSEVNVAPTFTRNGLKITISVKELPRVKGIVFTGNTLLSDDDLRDVVFAQPGLCISQELLRRDATRISQAYKAEKSLARVTNVSMDDNGVVSFTISEAKISRIQTSGLQIVTRREFTDAIGLAPQQVFIMDKIVEGVRRLQDTEWFETIEVELETEYKGDAPSVALNIAVRERPGIFPDRIGTPAGQINKQQLRGRIPIVGLDLSTAASVCVNEHLLGIEGQVTDALAGLRKTVDTEPPDPDDVLRYAQLLDAVGRTQQAQQQFARAEGAYRKKLADDADNINIQAKIGECLIGTGNFEQACDILGKAATAAPDQWQANVQFALAVGNHLMARLGEEIGAVPQDADADIPRSDPFMAMIQVMPWENTRSAVLDAIGAGQPESDLVALAERARESLARALKTAPSQSKVLTATCEVTFSAISMTVGTTADNEAVWNAVSEDAEQFFAAHDALRKERPGIALWGAFFDNLYAVLSLVASAPETASEDDVRNQLKDLAASLSRIAEKWPTVLRTSGRILGLLQLLSGNPELAEETFQQAIAQNPYNRQNYNALLGMAYETRRWERMAELVQQRLEYSPAAEDYVLLGKIALMRDNSDQAQAYFNQAIEKFEQDPLGYLALAGWLLRSGQDEKAQGFVTKALEIRPDSGYGHALQSTIYLLSDEPESATNHLQQAFDHAPSDELANLLRNSYFRTQ